MVGELTNWKLQLPVEKEADSNSILEIYPTRLNDQNQTGIAPLDNGYVSEYFYYDTRDSAIVFYCPVNGFKTPNTSYARSELREMIGDGSSENWRERRKSA